MARAGRWEISFDTLIEVKDQAYMLKRILAFMLSLCLVPHLMAGPKVSSASERKAQNLFTSGHFREAIPFAEKATSDARTINGPKSAEYALALSRLGALYGTQCRFSEAESFLAKAVTIIRGENPPRPEHRLAVENNLAEFYIDVCRFHAAESLLVRLLKVVVPGVKSMNKAAVMNSYALLGNAYRELGSMELADKSFTLGMQVGKESRLTETMQFAGLLDGVAMRNFDRGRYAVAESLFNLAYDIHWIAVGEHHPLTAMDFLGLAEVDDLWGSDKGAEILYRKSLDILLASYGSTHPRIAEVQNNLGAFLLGKDDPVEAEVLLRSTIEVYDRFEPGAHRMVKLALANLLDRSQFYPYRSTLIDSLLIYHRTFEEMESESSAPAINTICAEVSRLYRQGGKESFVSAESLIVANLDGLIAMYGKDHPGMGLMYWSLAQVISRESERKGYKESCASALGYFIRAFQVMVKNYGQHYTFTRKVRSEIYTYSQSASIPVSLESILSGIQ